jgi:transmembrane protein TMEM260 (protein O-mannosyltransferase)
VSTGRPPYGVAAGVALLVLLGYVLTLAPGVTFWDAGEFIAAARVLGIPHPPGTPLYVMIAHVWGMLVPFGEFAARTNFLSALLSAAGAGCFFLVAHESLRELKPRLRLGAAAAGAVLGGFTFTNWQNSNETEVYAVATFTIGAMSWLALLWRRRRGEPRAGRLLLLIVYLAGMSIGNHLLALLAGPAVVAFLVVTLRAEPAAHPAVRRAEWGQVAVVAGLWALLIGTGLGSTALTAVGALCFVTAAVYAAGGGAGLFALASLALALVAVTPYLYLYLRSAQHPPINEAAPATFDALLAVIRRAQYPPRTPLDDPTLPSGATNPGRSLALLGAQIGDYAVWFDWQWARSLRGMLGPLRVGSLATLGPLPVRTLVTLVFASLGLRGAFAQRRQDRAAWWLLFMLWLVTGFGLVAYMNFRPGYDRWFNRWPEPGDHEVRERDYFFVVSFIVWGIWAGMGVGALVRTLAAQAASSAHRWAGVAGRAAPALLLLAAVPPALNWRDASRRHGPDARLPADFAYDLLNSAPPYGILFTFGDNDTFPLWWAQEVAGIRQDVTVVCLALANTDWYMRQLRDAPARPLDAAALPAVWRGRIIPRPTARLHTMTDSMIQSAMNGYLVRGTQQLTLGPLTRILADGSVLYPNDILVLAVIQQNLGRRPMVWASTAGRTFAGLKDYIVQRGLGFELGTALPDTTSPDLDLQRFAGVPIDVATTDRLVFDTYRYADLLERGAEGLENTSASIAATLGLPPALLVYAHASRGELDRMQRAMELAVALSPNPDLQAALQTVADSATRPLQERPKLK